MAGAGLYQTPETSFAPGAGTGIHCLSIDGFFYRKSAAFSSLSLSGYKLTKMTLPKNFAKTVLLTGLLAGTLDATAACIQYYINTGKNPALVFRYVASATFGNKVMTGNLYGWAACGLLFHFLIAISFTLFFFLMYPQIKKWIPNKFVAGILYGLFVWVIMNMLVVPISFGKPIFDIQSVIFKKAAVAAAILIVAIGLPVSLIANRYYSKK
jgi:hypothetical protein